MRVLERPLLDAKTDSARSPVAQTLKSKVTAMSGGTLFEIWGLKREHRTNPDALFFIMGSGVVAFLKESYPKKKFHGTSPWSEFEGLRPGPRAECIIPT